MTLYLAAEAVDNALRAISSLSVYDTGSDPQAFAVGLKWLDMILDETVGTKRIWFFVPATLQLPLEADVTEYNVANLLATNRLQFVRSAYLLRDGNQIPLDLVRRREFDDVSDDIPVGTPEKVYVERGDDPTLTIYPAPIAGDILLLNGQGYPNNILTDKGRVAHGFPASWQLWMVNTLASHLGAGPVLTLPEQQLQRLERRAKESRAALDAYSNAENVRQPRKVKPREF